MKQQNRDSASVRSRCREQDLKLSCLESSLHLLKKQRALDQKNIERVKSANRELSAALKTEKERSRGVIESLVAESESAIMKVNELLAAAKAREREMDRESVAALSAAREKSKQAIRREQSQSLKKIQRAERRSRQIARNREYFLFPTLPLTENTTHSPYCCSFQ